jgi:hypothetical protein
MYAYRYSVNKVNAVAYAKKATQKKEDKQQTTIQAVSFEAIISLVQINLSQDFYLDFVPTFSKLLLFVHHSFEEPAFVNSYFKNTFCHHIAINAP